VPERRVAGLWITMIGHATVLIQAGRNFLVDPVWSERQPIRFRGTDAG
jgi:L-ascorbate metabolism protein UlaG (beta-lactamase superfamily)